MSPRANVANVVMARGRCSVCLAEFAYRVTNEAPPSICGRIYCHAIHDWTDAQWDGQRRMADARTAAGIPLTALDRAAQKRAAA